MSKTEREIVTEKKRLGSGRLKRRRKRMRNGQYHEEQTICHEGWTMPWGMNSYTMRNGLYHISDTTGSLTAEENEKTQTHQKHNPSRLQSSTSNPSLSWKLPIYIHRLQEYHHIIHTTKYCHKLPVIHLNIVKVHINSNCHPGKYQHHSQHNYILLSKQLKPCVHRLSQVPLK